MNGPSAAPELLAAVGRAVSAAGLDLEEVQLRRGPGRDVLRILVDSASGITLDEVAAVSGAISAELDASGAMGERPYVLDVGSPGVERPLTLLRHYRRNIGRLVRIRRASGEVLEGRIVEAEGVGPQDPPAMVMVDLAGGRQRVPADTITRAVVQVEFTDGPQEA